MSKYQVGFGSIHDDLLVQTESEEKERVRLKAAPFSCRWLLPDKSVSCVKTLWSSQCEPSLLASSYFLLKMDQLLDKMNKISVWWNIWSKRGTNEHNRGNLLVLGAPQQFKQPRVRGKAGSLWLMPQEGQLRKLLSSCRQRSRLVGSSRGHCSRHLLPQERLLN